MLRTWWSARKSRGASSRLAKTRQAKHLQLESLEDRLLLATRTWSGTGPDANWSTSGNWAENVAPAAGDDLVFPSGAARLVNSNNLTAETSFNSLTFTGGGYALSGNAVTVGANGITNNVTGPAPAANTVNLRLTLPDRRSITVSGTSSLILSGVLSGAGGVTKAGDGTLQLAGNAANTYTGETLVNAGTLELNKSAGTLAVPAALTVGDASGTDLVRLLANDQIAAATNATIRGGTLAFSTFTQTLAGLALTGGSVTGTTGTLTLTGNVTTSAADGSATLSGNLAFGAAARTFTVADGPAADDLIISAAVSGSGEVLKAGPGKLVFSGTNTYTGTTTVQAGTLNLRNAAALGATSAGTTVASQAILELQGGIAVGTEALTLNGAASTPTGVLRNVGDNNSWAGTITLAAEASVIDVAGGQLTVTGTLSSALLPPPTPPPQNLTKRGAGTLVYGGTAPNQYTGTTTVAEGILLLNKSAGVAALAGPLVVGDGTGDPGSDIVRLAAANQILDTAQLTIVGSGLLDLNGNAETVGPLTLTGGRVTTGAGTLTLTGNVTTNAAAAAATISGNLALGGGTRTFTVADGTAAEDLVLAAVVSGAAGAGLSKEGPGTLRLDAVNTYTGPTAVTAGTLLVNGTQAGSDVTVAVGATLGGSGTVGAVTVNGTLAPGTSPGQLRTGNVTFNTGATFRAELNGTTAGTGYDQVSLTGTVNLGGATLNATLGFTSVGGNQYIIFANDGTDAVTGTFNGLAEGANLPLNGRPFRISYRGGDGNDVVLTDASVATNVTLTSSALTAVVGQSVTFTAVVAPTSGSGTPTGNVVFRAGDTTLATVALTNGRATFTTFTLAVGSRQITASYEGDSTFSPSTSAALTQVVNKAVTNTVVTVTPSPALVGQLVTLTATVTVVVPGSGTPTGNVTFRDGTTVLGVVAVNASGVAVFTTSTLTAGAHVITAVYAGDSNVDTSTSALVNLQVTPAVPTTERYVTQMYVDLLRRQPDSEGLTAWTTQINRGAGRDQVALAFTASREYRELVVRDMYRKYLRRDADPNGLSAFINFLGTTGRTVEQLASIFLASAEYYTRAGGTNDGWLTAAYTDVLGRVTDPAGRAAHLAGLSQGVSRLRIAEIILTSDENRRRDVTNLYRTYLRRDPDAGGLNVFVNELHRGARLEQVLSVIVGSTEYFNRV